MVRVVTLGLAGAVAACSPESEVRVDTIEIVAFGILEFSDPLATKDPTSSVGAPLTRAKQIRVARQTDRIPIRKGLAYGVAFRARGAGAAADVKVVLRSSVPCVLKQTGESVYHNDTVLRVQIGELRHIGGKIGEGADTHCRDAPQPGVRTFELLAGERKLAEKSFELFRE